MKKGLIAYFAGCAVITVLLFFPYSIRIDRNLPNVLDPLFYTWNLIHDIHAIGKAPEAMLSAGIFWPYTNTLAFSDTLWSQTIAAFPLTAITHNPILVQNLSVLFTFPIAAFSMCLFGWYLTKNKFASCMSGLLYAFCYPRISQIGHLPAVSSQWLPLVFLFVLKYLDRGGWKNLAAAYVFFALSIGSSVYFAIYSIPAAAVIGALYLIRWIFRKNLWKNVGSRMKAIAILAVPMIAGIVILFFPYIRLRAEHPEFRRSLGDLNELRASIPDYFRVLPTSTISKIGVPSADAEHALYPTIAILIFAGIGILRNGKRNRFTVLLFSAITLVSFILSLGDELHITDTVKFKLPYYYLYVYTPIFRTVRVPARLGIFVMLGLVPLAAYGLASLNKTRKGTAIAFTGMLLFFLEIWQTNTPSVPVPSLSDAPPVYRQLNTLAPGSVLFLPIRRFWLGSPMPHQLTLTYDRITSRDNYAADTYRMYFSTLHSHPIVNGYSGFFPPEYTFISESCEQFPKGNCFGAARERGIKYIVVNGAMMDTASEEIESAVQGTPDVRLIATSGTDLVYEIDPTKNK